MFLSLISESKKYICSGFHEWCFHAWEKRERYVIFFSFFKSYCLGCYFLCEFDLIMQYAFFFMYEDA